MPTLLQFQRPCWGQRLRAIALALSSAAILPLEAEIPFSLSATIPSPSPKLQADEGQGSAIALDGNILVDGAAASNLVGSGKGAVRVYDLGSATPNVPQHVLLMPTEINFGTAVAVSGTHVITNPAAASGDQFGTRLTLDGARLLVGTPSDDVGAANAGSARVSLGVITARFGSAYRDDPCSVLTDCCARDSEFLSNETTHCWPPRVRRKSSSRFGHSPATARGEAFTVNAGRRQ